jgi:hypothetical protein
MSLLAGWANVLVNHYSIAVRKYPEACAISLKFEASIMTKISADTD